MTACVQSPDPPKTRPVAGERRAGGTMRLNMLRGQPASLDPIRVNSKVGDDIALQVFDRLVTFDESMTLRGELAQRWDVSDDGRLLTFHLRTDVFFHNDPCFPNGKGRRFVARDVVLNLQRCCRAADGSVAAWAFVDRVVGARDVVEGRSQDVSGIVAIDDSTVRIELLRPDNTFLGALANALGGIMAPEAWQKYGSAVGRHPVGTGPFILHSWKDDIRMTMVRNPSYWQMDSVGNRLPYLDSIVVTFLTNDNQQLTAFQQGYLDECTGIPIEAFPLMVDTTSWTLRGRYERYVLQHAPAWCTWFVDMHTARPPFNNVHLRRALAYAVDRHRLVRYVLAGMPWSAAHHGIVPDVLPWYDTDSVRGIGFDPSRARSELALAIQDGVDCSSITLALYSEPRLRRTAEALQGMWRDVLGIDVALKQLNFATFLEQSEGGHLMMWATRWYGDYPDPETFLGLYNGDLLPSDPQAPSYPNSTRYRDPSVAGWIRRGVSAGTTDERARAYRLAEQRIVDDAPSVILFHDRHVRLLQPWVRNYRLDPMARIVLKTVWFHS